MPNQPAISMSKSALLSVLVFALAGGALYWTFSTVPEAQRSGAVKKTPMLVDVAAVEHGSFEPVLEVTGTVRAEKDVALSAQVSGAILSRNEAFSPGRFVKKGTPLLQIDPTSFRLALARQKSELAQIQTNLTLEMGQQDLAAREYDTLFEGEDLSPTQQELALRRPQLRAARARVEAAKTAVQQAELDLARTTITAPFDAQVIEQQVDVGAHVQPGTKLGRLVGVGKYWVEASLPLHQRRWLRFPDSRSSGRVASQDECSRVELRNRASWPPEALRVGCLARLIGSLDEMTRMARVLIEVDDPLGREANDPQTTPPLMIGEFVEARIVGRRLDGVARIPRRYVRKGDTTWVARDGELHIAKLDIVLFDAHYAYDRGSLQEGDRIVTTDLAQVRPGAPLRIRGQGAEGQSAQTPPSTEQRAEGQRAKEPRVKEQGEPGN